jgi:hypothetical protein
MSCTDTSRHGAACFDLPLYLAWHYSQIDIDLSNRLYTASCKSILFCSRTASILIHRSVYIQANKYIIRSHVLTRHGVWSGNWTYRKHNFQQCLRLLLRPLPSNGPGIVNVLTGLCLAMARVFIEPLPLNGPCLINHFTVVFLSVICSEV